MQSTVISTAGLVALGAVPLLVGCIQEMEGFDPGPCAGGRTDDGQLDIGTCIAGPVDLDFVKRDGRTWLAVANADPFRNFASGSVLLIDLDSIDLDRRENPVHELVAHATPTDPFVGGLAAVPDRNLLLATERFSRQDEEVDRVQVIDVSDPTSPEPWGAGEEVPVELDPQPVVHDPEAGRAYVVNLTSGSVSVIDTQSTPLSPVDVAPRALVGLERFFDHDKSGSTAEIDFTVHTPTEVDTDAWTLSWLEGTYRLWVPTGPGLSRWNTAGKDYVPAGIAVEVDPQDSPLAEEVVDPFHGTADGVPVLYYGDGGDIRSIRWDAVEGAWSWTTAGQVLLSSGTGWRSWVGGPSVLSVEGQPVMFFEGRDDDGIPRIGRAAASETGFAPLDEPVLHAPPELLGAAQPFVRPDTFTDTLRMWMSLWDGERWTIGHAQSTDGGFEWSTPEEVLALPDEDLAAPVITWANGRYVMWLTQGDGEVWSHATAWSWDGLEWFDLQEVLDSDQPYDLEHPPRLALQAEPRGAWRVEGASAGWMTAVADSAIPHTPQGQGFSFRVAHGFEVGAQVLGPASVNGIEPGSLAQTADGEVLYVTGWDADMRPSISAVTWDGQRWKALETDLIPSGVSPNHAGVQSPVVFQDGDDFRMFFAARTQDGPTEAFQATSPDGRVWQPSSQPVLPDPESWETEERRPHSVEQLDNGEIRLWYSGTDGARWRIGAALRQDGTFVSDPANEAGWQLDEGPSGGFDANGVRDPMVIRDGNVQHLWYAGFDGEVWRIGQASRSADGDAWERVSDPLTGRPQAVLGRLPQTFADTHVFAPVVDMDDQGELLFFYAGDDGAKPRIGAGTGDLDALFPAVRFPTVGDEIRYQSRRGEPGVTAIDLAQELDGFTTSGDGLSGARLDPERGFLYIPSQQANYIYVVDVRKDSERGFNDLNSLDLEAVLVVSSVVGPQGFRDVLPIPGTDLLYATSVSPNGVWVLDISDLEDEGHKRVVHLTEVDAIPLGSEPDPEHETFTRAITGGVMDVTPDGRFVLVPHFLDNSLVVVDRNLGLYGQPVRRLGHVGKNPHLVRVSPDGRLGVVANYVGELDDLRVQSNLAIVDLDPHSPTFLEVLTWLVNQ